jgi:hypothetical protein
VKLLSLLFAAFLVGCSVEAAPPKDLTLHSNGAKITVLLSNLVTFSDGQEKLVGAFAVAEHPNHGQTMLRYNVLLSTCFGGQKVIFITLPTGHEILYESDGTDAPGSPAATLHDAICKASKNASLKPVPGPDSLERGKDA